MDGGTAERRNEGTIGNSDVPTFQRSEVLVVQTAFLGDVVLTTPLLAVLAQRHGPVDIVTTPAAASLVETHPAVAQVLVYDKNRSDRGLRGLHRLGSIIRARRYRSVYLPHRSLRSAALALWSGAKERIGFADSAAAFTYTRRVSRPTAGHEVERLLALAEPIVGERPPVSLTLTAQDQAAAEAWLSDHGVGARFVAVAPGSIWGTKRWPYYGALVSALEDPAVVIGGPEDVALGEAIVQSGRAGSVNAAGALTLRQSAALLQRARVLVTNDSAPLHLATAVGTPVVALFGPTVPEFGFGPRRPGDLTLGHGQLACRPCSRHGPETCPLGHHRCMRDLPVELVLKTVATVSSAEESRAICPGD